MIDGTNTTLALLDQLENTLSGLAEPIKQGFTTLYNDPTTIMDTASKAAFTFVETHPYTTVLAVAATGLAIYAYKKGLFNLYPNIRLNLGADGVLGGFEFHGYVGKKPVQPEQQSQSPQIQLVSMQTLDRYFKKLPDPLSDESQKRLTITNT